MTYQEFNEEVDNISNDKLLQDARNILRKLCATGGRSFTMTVPPRLDDTDIVLSEIISRFEKLTKQ